ncbi:T9SS type A sorting domain-containing protein [Christiangramia sabulilitoris]|nr:T9SS type A sorting domain-containing protein [Christiangramia sabulilitoris]
MKLPLLFLLIFSVTSLSAQLYITPSTESDGYIYVKDRLLYVEKEIFLKENRNKESEANLYLRKGSQLLQGIKDENLNKGTGKLSVFQKGTSNAFDYNYWSLPVKLTGDHLKLSDYLYDPKGPLFSSNASLTNSTDGKSNPLNISSTWLYTFSGTNYSNWAYVGDHFDLIPGEGFTMKGVNGINLQEIEGIAVNAGNSQTYDFRGLPNDGTIELPIKKDQILLVGNPYPSAIDLNKFLKENTFSTGIAYFWDSRDNGNSHYLSDYEGGYGTYSPGTGIYIPPVFKKYSDGSETGMIGKHYERQISPIGQGFMIIGKKDGRISFKNSQRIFQKEQENYSMFKTSLSGRSSLNLIVEIDSSFIQKLALVFDPDSSPEEDHALDARKMNNDPQDISWEISNENFVVNVRPKLDQELIPLKIKLSTATQLKFSVSELENFNPDRVFLYDAREDLYFSIKTGYLSIDLPQGEIKDRFYLSFIEKITEDEKADPESNRISDEKLPNILLNSIDIFQNNSQAQLEIKLLYDSGISSIRLYDLTGKLFLHQKFKSTEKEFYFSTGNLSNAIYIVKVNTTDNIELTKKIGIKN